MHAKNLLWLNCHSRFFYKLGPRKSGAFFLLAKGAGASDLATDGRAVDGKTGTAAGAASAHTRARGIALRILSASL